MQRLSMPESKSNPQSSLRCHHCAGPLTKEMETSQWTVRPLIRDSFSMIGSAVGGTTSAFYGFNHVMPVVRRWVKGPMWLHFFIGAPPVIVFSSACAGLAGGAVPALAQLASSSYHAAFSAPSLPPPSQDDKRQKSRNSSTLMAMTCFLVMISINSHFFSIANLLKMFPLSKSTHAATLLKFSG